MWVWLSPAAVADYTRNEWYASYQYCIINEYVERRSVNQILNELQINVSGISVGDIVLFKILKKTEPYSNRKSVVLFVKWTYLGEGYAYWHEIR